LFLTSLGLSSYSFSWTSDQSQHRLVVIGSHSYFSFRVSTTAVTVPSWIISFKMVTSSFCAHEHKSYIRLWSCYAHKTYDASVPITRRGWHQRSFRRTRCGQPARWMASCGQWLLTPSWMGVVPVIGTVIQRRGGWGQQQGSSACILPYFPGNKWDDSPKPFHSGFRRSCQTMPLCGGRSSVDEGMRAKTRQPSQTGCVVPSQGRTCMVVMCNSHINLRPTWG
jgi:hypothetical protein